MTDGICPIAEFIPGLIDGVSYLSYGGPRVGFCDHTAGGYMSTMRNPGFWNANRVSAHFAIGRDGSVIQLVNIFHTAFAQGILHNPITWPPFDTMQAETGTPNPNWWLISTEHEDQTVTNAVWTPEQYASDLAVKKWCVEEVRRVLGQDALRFEVDSLAGHFMFDPVNRSYCPGSNWPRSQLYRDLTIAPEDDDMSTVIDSWPQFWQGLQLAGGQSRRVNIWADFTPNQGPKQVEIEVGMAKGYLVVKNGDGKQAGRVGWGVAPGQPSYNHLVVTPDAEGWCELLAEDANNPVQVLFAHGVRSWP